jgi:hypothetical protein
MASNRIEGERLDIVLQKLREKGESTPLDGVEEFEALLNRPGPAHGSIDAHLLDYVMPRVTDGSIFQENRAILLLKMLREIIVGWREGRDGREQEQEENEGEDAGGKDRDNRERIGEILRVIDDEISRYEDVLARRNAGIAA